MLRPPRNLRTDRLMSTSMLVYCYCFAGLLNIAAGFIGYILVFNSYNLSLTDIFMSVQKHFIVGAEDFVVRGTTYNESQQVRRPVLLLLKKHSPSYPSYCGAGVITHIHSVSHAHS